MKLFHVLKSQQFDRERLDYLCSLSTVVRKVAKSRAGSDFLRSRLSHRRAMLYFTQPSTRTFLSFLNACQILGIQTSEIRDPSTSSEYKGEDLKDALRTFSSYVDLIVMRTNREGVADRIADHLDATDRPIPVINAGSGKDQHPSQALLDVYTLHRSFQFKGGIDGKTIAMVGDLARGRTVRSLCYLMKNYEDVRLVFVSPHGFGMLPDLKEFLTKRSIAFEETDDLRDVLPRCDALYMTRVQDEHDVDDESHSFDADRFTLHYDDLARLREDAVIMHPLPRRQEIDRRIDGDSRAMYWRQARNGMWMRVAMIATIFDVAGEILDHAADVYTTSELRDVGP